MPDYEHSVNHHYGNFDLSARILEKLRNAGKDPASLTREDLSQFDEFHTGGRASTRELAALAGLKPGMAILDVGSGIGGPARTLAAEFNATVTGLDLTDEFCRAATMLTKLVGLSGQATFVQGNAVDMPFPDSSFDAVWSQNTIMNIADKKRLFHEVRRVLRAGGVFALEGVFAGRVKGTIYPTFWASSAEIDFLIPHEEARDLLKSTGFQEEVWEDTTGPILEAALKRHAPKSPDPKRLGRDVIVASNVSEKIENAVHNLQESRIVTARAVFRAV